MAYEIDQQSVTRAEKRFKETLAESDIVAAVLSTSGGRILAWGSKFDAILPTDIAKMATYITNLGSMLAHGESSTRYNRTVCDIKGNPVIITTVARFLLTVVGDSHANIGKVVGYAEQLASDFRHSLKVISDVQANDAVHAGPDREETQPRIANDRFVFDADGFTERVLADIEAQKNQPAV
jgi:hypothetical protein